MTMLQVATAVDTREQNEKYSTAAVTEAEISKLVDTFYRKVREDATIGPIFDAFVKDWPSHLILLKNFWSTVLLGAAKFRGDPMATHMKLPLEREHFEHWLALFAETATELLSPHNAATVIRKSEQIAKNFQLAIAYERRQPAAHVLP
ncbi:truncated hemoglobin [soil metagenome]